MKGLFGNFTEPEVNDELRKLGWKNVEFVKITQTVFDKTRKIPVFSVQISNQSDVKELTSLKVLLYQKVTWEPLRKNEVFQCTSCQRLGHARNNCTLA